MIIIIGAVNLIGELIIIVIETVIRAVSTFY